MEIERAEDHFAVRLIPPRPTFHADMSDEERAVMSAHVEYYQQLMKTGRVVVYGPVIDSTGGWGLGVIQGDSEADVRALVDADPAVVAGVMTPELGTMPVAIVRR
ncbi:MAG TPA: YciI family protein [Solirubrobacteraceae bacterium]|nr:YciI family protein [Solirubrobacteraceae bacterium]